MRFASSRRKSTFAFSMAREYSPRGVGSPDVRANTGVTVMSRNKINTKCGMPIKHLCGATSSSRVEEDRGGRSRQASPCARPGRAIEYLSWLLEKKSPAHRRELLWGKRSVYSYLNCGIDFNWSLVTPLRTA